MAAGLRPTFIAKLPHAELRRRIPSGNTEAFSDLTGQHNRVLFPTARSMLRDDAQAASAEVQAAQRARTHILVVDTDPSSRELIADYLRQNELRVTTVADGPGMMAVLVEEVIDLVVLDPKLGDEDGMALTRRLRDKSAIPIIMVSNLSEEADRVMGLELGADDYLTKPFSRRELLARIRTILRRRPGDLRQGRPEGVRAYRFGPWELNLGTRRLTAKDRETVALSNGEFNLLVALLGAPNRVLSRNQLLDRSRLHNDEVLDRSIDVQIMRLRRLLERDATGRRYIKTERGAGYVFTAGVETVR
jgi:DNA-binding response OmpR family regulator